MTEAVQPVWCVMPVLAGPEMTEAAIGDLLTQTLPTRVLVVNQGIDSAFRDRLERIAEHEPRLLLWHHVPSLPSLSATWNAALEYIFGLGEPCALVVNNDVRLHQDMLEALVRVMTDTDALFVSAVGVTAQEFRASGQFNTSTRGGPDFSCFLIGSDCHMRFRFDEHFIPAFCEDLDYHRRLMLAGEGSRIFSTGVPYLHLASQTLKGDYLDEEEKQRIRESIERHSRTYYARKWGGPVNEETYYTPFDRGGGEGILVNPDLVGPSTPELQHGQKHRPTRSHRRTLTAPASARPQGSGMVPIQSGDLGSPRDGALHLGAGDAGGDAGDAATDPDGD